MANNDCHHDTSDFGFAQSSEELTPILNKQCLVHVKNNRLASAITCTRHKQFWQDVLECPNDIIQVLEGSGVFSPHLLDLKL